VDLYHPVSPDPGKSSATIKETHLIRTEGMQDVFYNEEHFSSEIKSYVVCAPPQFIRVSDIYMHT
jgi:hypothetical protein